MTEILGNATRLSLFGLAYSKFSPDIHLPFVPVYCSSQALFEGHLRLEAEFVERPGHVETTAGLTATARTGIAAVRALNAILIKRYRDNTDLLAEWTAAQRIAGWPSQAATSPAAPVAPGS